MHPSSRTSSIHRLGVARLISITGSEAAHIALVALVLGRTGSPAWVALALVASIGTQSLVSPLAGLVGDRLDRRRVMIASDLAAAGCFVALALVGAPWAAIVLAAAAAIAESPFVPASQAAIPNLVPDGRLAWANGTLTTHRMVGHLAGPLAGGALVAVAGPAGAFLVNAASFAASAALVVSVRGDFRARRVARAAEGGALAGFRFLVREPVLRVVTAAYAVFLLGVGVVVVAELPLAQAFGTGSIGFGMLAAGWGGGGLVGAALSTRLLRGRSEVAGLVVGLSLMGVGLSAGGVSPWFAPVVAGMLVGGLGGAIMHVAEQTLVQRRAPDAVRSRVVAAGEGVALVAFGVSFGAGGPLVGALGPRPAYLVAAAGCAVGVALLTPLWREPRAGGLAAERAP
jgi:MFS family permease